MSENKNHKKYVHPLISWAAVFSTSLIGCLTYAMLYAQAAEPAGTTSKPVAQVSACRQACYTAYGACAKSAGDDQEALSKCKSAGGHCVSACGSENGQGSTESQKPMLSACVVACYTARNECAKQAGTDSTAMHQCNVTGMSCMTACGKPAEGTQQAYQAAVQAARQHYLEGQQKLLDEFQSALEKAWSANMQSKGASSSDKN